LFNQKDNEKKYTGTRCHICTGCGRCFSVTDKRETIQILTGQGGNDALFSVPQAQKRRLVTVDIGTTTVAMQFYDRIGKVQDVYARVNPQVEFGADVLSRVQAAEKQENLKKMQRMVREVIGQGVERFRALLAEGEELYMVLVANTTMVYLLMGWDPAELGRAPFLASHLEAFETDLDGVACYVFGGLSAFVGGDIVAGIHAGEIAEREEISLLIDLGTNGEMVLGNATKLVACSTAAGSAFEGGANRGVWGADMISLLAKLRRRELVDETGLLQDPYFEEGILIGDVRVTQKAIREIQLAKGAIRAGIEILANHYGIPLSKIDRVILAGGFGYFLRPEDAVAIGLLPKELLGKTVSGGNTALVGAAKLGSAKLSADESGESLSTGELRSKTEVINLAQMPEFQELYLSFMDFEA